MRRGRSGETGDSGPDFYQPILVALLLTRFFAAALASNGFLNAFLFAGLQVEGVPLDLLDCVFLLNLALEAPKGVL